MKLLLGIDIGTSAIKISVFSLKGVCVYSSKYKYPTIYPNFGEVEQNPNHWWRGVIYIIRKIFEKMSPKDILAIGLSGLNGLVPVDEQGNFLRNAIIYTDRRSIRESSWIEKNLGSEKVFELTGNRISPGTFSASLILWIRDNDSDIYDRTYKFLVPASYIALKLTNQFVIDWSRASMTLLFDIRKRAWSKELFHSMRIPIQKVPDAVSSWTVVGKVCKEATINTGLLQGTPVVIGGMDSMCAAVGGGVVEPGIAVDIGGSAGGITLCSDKPIFNNKFLNVCYVVPDLWASIGPMNTAAASLEWYKENFAQLELLMAKRIGISPFDLLCQEAKDAAPGSRGLVFLPYLAGERCPIWNPLAKAVWFGMTLKHRKNEFTRSILEGVAFGLRHIIETFELNGATINELRTIGGGAKSQLWGQIKADIFGKTIVIPTRIETATLGAAILAGYGIGIFDDLKSKVKEIVLIKKRIEPQKQYERLYTELYSMYKYLSEFYRKNNLEIQ